MSKDSDHNYDHKQNLSQADYDKLMESLNEQLDKLWAEIEQDETLSEFLIDDD
jgi:hypothetical protein